MDDCEKKPQVEFANMVLDEYVDHILGGSKVKPKDYLTMRVVFRRLGGSWYEISSGNVVHILLLAEVVKAWNKAANV